MNPARLTLDNPAFSGRLRQSSRSPAYVSRPSPLPVKTISDITRIAKPRPEYVLLREGQAAARIIQDFVVGKRLVTSKPLIPPNAVSAPHRRPQKSQVLHREAAIHQQKLLTQRLDSNAKKKAAKVKYKRPIMLYAMAAIIFIVGLGVSLNGLRANRQVSAQVSQLSHAGQSGGNSTLVPSTTKPPEQVVKSYIVAPDLPRYLKIPKIGVDARVLQVGITKDGSIGTPSNVFDTSWYTGSAKPGQPGATFIDGHVSSWTTNGVFYNLKNLKAGDAISIERGDGKLLSYTVVKTQTYDADSVDMAAALTSADPSKSGLNLMTCTGKVKPGTSEFEKRVVVFAVQS